MGLSGFAGRGVPRGRVSAPSSRLPSVLLDPFSPAAARNRVEASGCACLAGCCFSFSPQVSRVQAPLAVCQVPQLTSDARDRPEQGGAVLRGSAVAAELHVGDGEGQPESGSAQAPEVLPDSSCRSRETGLGACWLPRATNHRHATTSRRSTIRCAIAWWSSGSRWSRPPQRRVGPFRSRATRHGAR